MSAPAPAPFVVGMNRSGTTLLRMMLDAHPAARDPARDSFRARSDPFRARPRRQARRRPGGDEGPSRVGGLRLHRRRGARLAGGLAEARAGPGGAGVLRGLRRPGRQAPLGREDPPLRAEDAADRLGPSGGPVRPRDPRRPRRRALGARPHREGRRRGGGRPALAAQDRAGARGRPPPGPLPGGAIRGARRRPRAGPEAGLRVRRARLRRGDAELSRALRGATHRDEARTAARGRRRAPLGRAAHADAPPHHRSPGPDAGQPAGATT